MPKNGGMMKLYDAVTHLGMSAKEQQVVQDKVFAECTRAKTKPMGPKIKDHEKADNESAYFSTSFKAEPEQDVRVCIGWNDEDRKGKSGTIAMQIIKWDGNKLYPISQANLNAEEIDEVIKGLEKAKTMLGE